MYYFENDNVPEIFLFLSVGLVVINLIIMDFMQDTVEKEEKIKIAVLTEQIIRTGKKYIIVSERKCTIIKISLLQFRRY